MATPVYPATNNREAIDLNISNANQFFTILQGGVEDFITTYEGEVEIPSVAKALSEAAAYKTPLAWETTGEETDLLQTRVFDENVYAPLSVPAPFGGSPSSTYWRLVQTNIAKSSTSGVDPVATNDSTEGYSINSFWINENTLEVFRCFDATESAAVWLNTALTLGELGTAAVANTSTLLARENHTGTQLMATISDAYTWAALDSDALLDVKVKYAVDFSTASFDLSTASYDNVSFDVSAQDTIPSGISFNNDGTQMYIVGTVNGSVHQYTLTSGFDLTTASYDNVSFDVSAQDTIPKAISFNNDGTKMFMVGFDNDLVHQYTLAISFDLSTASYDNVSFDVSAQDTLPDSLVFNNDGNKMFMFGLGTRSAHQYTLTSGFDLSTASYDNVSFSFSAQDSFPQAISFSNDGTVMFMVGTGTDTIYQYNLTSRFDLSTASYANAFLDIRNQDQSPVDILASNDGNKIFMVGSATDSVHQYTLPPAQRTLTLPPTPTTNDFIEIYNSAGDPVGSTIARNGSTIMGAASDLTLSSDMTSLHLVYNGSDWRIIRYDRYVP